MRAWVPNRCDVRLRKFFRTRLLALSNEEIVGYIEQLDKEVRALKEDALRMCWYMRGGLSYDDSMLLSKSERDIIGEIIKDNLETTKKSKMPFF
jgi:hypothetical protein